MKKAFRIIDPSQPLLVGLDHDNPSLGRLAEQMIEKFGKKGKTLFIEGPASSQADAQAGFLSREGVQIARLDSFLSAISKARKMGMKVVSLDSERIARLRSKVKISLSGRIDLTDAGLSLDEFRYLMHNVRERLWIRTIKKNASGGDIVLAHQNHIAGLAGTMPGFRNVLLLSEPYSSTSFPPLSNLEIARLRALRSEKRASTVRAKKDRSKCGPEVSKLFRRR
ncbi:MAG: hypothetical protein PHD95_03575 [Candidatus ainarchaeum sp.]|nr:hypothetical protein [Candidatus ainarchaeum sp.]